ncbi:hypothetical protein FB45DRAFT_869490 [Roridomyces roridus]|uniref:Uncharacterized protein n=1 Tax=Roridomyces roridus TaxID=1738132 RepID=A0AAD7FK07_9AGAR|nr:hypothetical protein FB45DRAFT_869490 [Roridomyces roridus]
MSLRADSAQVGPQVGPTLGFVLAAARESASSDTKLNRGSWGRPERTQADPAPSSDRIGSAEAPRQTPLPRRSGNAVHARLTPPWFGGFSSVGKSACNRYSTKQDSDRYCTATPSASQSPHKPKGAGNAEISHTHLYRRLFCAWFGADARTCDASPSLQEPSRHAAHSTYRSGTGPAALEQVEALFDFCTRESYNICAWVFWSTYIYSPPATWTEKQLREAGRSAIVFAQHGHRASTELSVGKCSAPTGQNIMTGNHIDAQLQVNLDLSRRPSVVSIPVSCSKWDSGNSAGFSSKNNNINSKRYPLPATWHDNTITSGNPSTFERQWTHCYIVVRPKELGELMDYHLLVCQTDLASIYGQSDDTDKGGHIDSEYHNLFAGAALD